MDITVSITEIQESQWMDPTAEKKNLVEGVPQGGVLSSTLVLIFINDELENLPRGMHGAMSADDLILQSSEAQQNTECSRHFMS